MIATTHETEQELIDTARRAVSDCHWTIGECASKWTEHYSRDRSDAAFADLIGATYDQVSDSRRVWVRFADVRDDYPDLKWSHFKTVVAREDATAALQWAQGNEATIKELRAMLCAWDGQPIRIDDESPGRPGDVDDESRETFDSIDNHEELAPITPPNPDPAETAYAPFRTSGGPPRDETHETHEAPEKPARGKSDIALVKAFWRAGRELINARGPVPAQALLAEMLSDHELTDEVEEVDEPRLKALLKSIED